MSLSVLLRHRFPGAQMDMAFEVASPGVAALFGHSGSGKSTIIAAAAGLLRPDECRIAVDGQTLADTAAGVWLSPERRRVGLVFQESRLFPHMSVRTNLRFGMRRVQGAGIDFDEVVELLGIGRLLARRPNTLSGGERQRVAIGRALLAQPRLLLMDEPLASLDSARKAEILPYLSRLKTMLRLPVLYVTHAFEEVSYLADSLVLLERGRVLAAGPLADMAARGDLPIGLRDDAGAVLAARVAAHDPARRLTRLQADEITIWVPIAEAELGAPVRARVLAREVMLARREPEEISVHNVIRGTVRAITEDPVRHAALVEVLVDRQAILARVTQDAVVRLGLAPGEAVFAMFKSVGVDVLRT